MTLTTQMAMNFLVIRKICFHALLAQETEPRERTGIRTAFQATKSEFHRAIIRISRALINRKDSLAQLAQDT